ncbi:helix-turn-helix transcriptional regulator [Chloroflexota bacterium]
MVEIKVTINPSYEWAKDAQDMGISHRELEVFSLIIQGNDNKKIAEILDIKRQSVKNHTYNLMKKLKVANGTQAFAVAILKNMIVVSETAGILKFEFNAKTIAESFSKEIEQDGSPKKKKIKYLIKAMEKHNINLDELKGKD